MAGHPGVGLGVDPIDLDQPQSRNRDMDWNALYDSDAPLSEIQDSEDDISTTCVLPKSFLVEIIHDLLAARNPTVPYHPGDQLGMAQEAVLAQRAGIENVLNKLNKLFPELVKEIEK